MELLEERRILLVRALADRFPLRFLRVGEVQLAGELAAPVMMPFALEAVAVALAERGAGNCERGRESEDGCCGNPFAIRFHVGSPWLAFGFADRSIYWLPVVQNDKLPEAFLSPFSRIAPARHELHVRETNGRAGGVVRATFDGHGRSIQTIVATRAVSHLRL